MDNEHLRIELLRKIDDLEKKGVSSRKTFTIVEPIENLIYEHALLQRKYEKLCEEKELELYNHIVTYWKEEYYKKCKQEWKDVERFILPETFTSGFMCNCGTKWSDKKFINDELKICCYCDTYVQPFLSNPLNKINVLKYIPEKYHSDILIEYRCISCKNVCEYDVKSYYNNTPLCFDCIEQLNKNRMSINHLKISKNMSNDPNKITPYTDAQFKEDLEKWVAETKYKNNTK